MLSPTDGDAPSYAPRLAASMIPGPPPLITAKPASDSLRAISTASWYIGASGVVRALPKIDTAGRISDRRSAASTNSEIIPHRCHDSRAFWLVARSGMVTARRLGIFFWWSSTVYLLQ